jgi:signal transduction histidine kinase
MAHPLLWVLGLLTVFASALGVVGWRQQPQPGARAFALMAAGTAWWTGSMVVGHLLDGAGMLAAFVFFTRVEWIGIFVMTFSWFVFALEYTGRSEYATRRIVGLLAFLPGLLYPIAFGNYLIVNAAGSALERSPAFPPSFDPWMAVEPLVVGYLYALIAVSSLLLLWFVLTSRLPHPEQAILWLLAVVVPWIVNALYVTGTIQPLGPNDVDPTPFGFVVLVAIGTIAIRQYDAFGVSPVARAYVVDKLDTGVVVYDGTGRLVDANEWARSTLGLTDRMRGRPVWAVLATATGETWLDDTDSADGADFTDRVDGSTVEVDADAPRADAGDGPRTLSIEASVLRRSFGEQVDRVDGYALLIRDVTARRRRKRALETQNEQLELVSQIVSHDIRNEMNVVLEIAGRLQQSVASDDPEAIAASVERHGEHLEQRGERTVELTERASDLVHAIEETGTEPEPIALRRTLEREVANASALSAAATVRIEEEIPDVAVLANEMLSSVFANLLTNAVQHNDAAESIVVVSATATDEAVVVRVADDGPGIPDDRKAEIFEQATTLDGDGSGLGLYLVGTIVDQYGGEVWVEDRAGSAAIGGSSTGGVDARSEATTGELAGAFADESGGSVFVVKLRRA